YINIITSRFKWLFLLLLVICSLSLCSSASLFALFLLRFVLLLHFVVGQVEHGMDLVSALAYAMISARRERTLSVEAATFWLVTVIIYVSNHGR
ncbi:hypothetical protein RYX36_023512, partial [Vicia faba]